MQREPQLAPRAASLASARSTPGRLGPLPDGILGRAAGLSRHRNPNYCLAATDAAGGYRSLYLAACNFADPYQRWNLTAEIRNVTGMCLTSPAGAQDWTPVTVTLCYPYPNVVEASQAWFLQL